MMSRVAWIVLGLALFGVISCDDSIEDPDGDGVLGGNNSAEELIVSEGLNEDFREQNAPNCVLLDPTDNEPTKHLLDVSSYSMCNNYDTEVWGECNCPALTFCEFDGVIEEARTYYCRQQQPSDSDQYGQGLILGELENPRVFIVEGADKK